MFIRGCILELSEVTASDQSYGEQMYQLLGFDDQPLCAETVIGEAWGYVQALVVYTCYFYS